MTPCSQVPLPARGWALRAGATITLPGVAGDATLRVAGDANAAPRLRYIVMDIAAVQDRFGYDARLTRIDLRLRPGADPNTVRERLQNELPPGVAVVAPATRAFATARLSRAYRVNLSVLALVALFTGGTLVFATQTLSVAYRRRQFALLRALGLTRRRLLALVICEAGGLGTLGAAAGLAIGYAVAFAVLRRFGADLGAGYFGAGTIPIIFEPLPALAFAALGVGAAVVGSVAPARNAANAAPAAALRGNETAGTITPARAALTGWIAIGLGAAATLVPAIDGLPVCGYAAIALILIGAILVIPQGAQVLLRAIGTPQALPPALALALARLRAYPGQIGVSLAAFVTSVALMVSMIIMVGSFRQSLDDWLATMLPADLYLRADAGVEGTPFSSAEREAIRSTPGIARVEFMRTAALLIDPARPRIALLARDIDPADAAQRLPLVERATIAGTAGDLPPAWISEALADLLQLAPGATLTLPLAGGNAMFRVAGVWRDYGRQQGAVVIERSRYAALTGDDGVNEAALWLEPGANLAQVRAALGTREASERLTAATPQTLRARALAVFDRSFALTYAIEAAAVLIGLVGLSATIAAQTLARRREFALLRHIGMTRRTIACMLATEGALLGALGVAMGSVLGFAISLILIEIVNRQSFHWSMDLHLRGPPLAALAGGLLALATLTAAASALKAMAGDAVPAVRDDG